MKQQNKPNRKRPHIRGPIVVDIHDNPVRVNIRVKTINMGMGNQDIPHTLFSLDDSIIAKLREIKGTYPNAYGRINLSSLNQSSRPRRKKRSTSEYQSSSDGISSKVLIDETPVSALKLVAQICKDIGLGALLIGGTVAINHWWKKRG